MPEDTIEKIRRQLQDGDPEDLFHFGLGIKVRNSLRKEFEWNDQVLDRLWRGILIRAVGE
ncbi:hypothetical protein [Fuchsiella alkaliacetigena]|uniref:hypothetical protein n=1 Tax=Fuchsiella alkaliacetigena TaxID=957042 RepID=UPI00200AF6ED|nr:hypothetical protein [Fuchsiella alkaliacetigena]MCK8824687.1 hypothetical protein [Fuchsiella alkaliacetigena]